MNEQNKTAAAPTGPGRMRRLFGPQGLFALIAIVTLVALFYAEENWRGKRAWQLARRELEAKGEQLDWSAVIPQPVPDGQNVMEHPFMKASFVKGTENFALEVPKTFRTKSGGMLLACPLAELKTAGIPLPEIMAWLDQAKPQLQQFEEAVQRPYSRLKGNYNQPMELPIPNFTSFRFAAQLLDTRCKVNLLLGNPDAALRDFVLLRRLADCVVANEPTILVSEMIRVAMVGLCADNLHQTLGEGLWPERHLATLQTQMSGLNLPAGYKSAMRFGERAAVLHVMEGLLQGDRTRTMRDVFAANGGKMDLTARAMVAGPRGWIYQNMATYARLIQLTEEGIDPVNQRIDAGAMERGGREVVDYLSGEPRPWNCLSFVAMPNFIKALQTLSKNQTKANEAYLACALERYRAVEGKYPNALGELTPKYADKLPQELMTGQGLQYRLKGDGKYLLYSVGWDGKDEGGQTQVRDGVTEWGVAGGDWPW